MFEPLAGHPQLQAAKSKAEGQRSQQEVPVDRGTGALEPLHALQRAVGNQATVRLMSMGEAANSILPEQPRFIFALQHSSGNQAVNRLLAKHGQLLQRQQATSKNGVTSIDPVTGPGAQAITGFPNLAAKGCDLNAPGLVNNTTTGTCRNIHQILFHLSGIRSGDVSLMRIVERTTVVNGKKETINKSDGPSVGTVARPSDSVIAVADCPGFFPESPNSPDPRHFRSVTTPISSCRLMTLCSRLCLRR